MFIEWCGIRGEGVILTIGFIVFYVLFPIFVIYLCHNYKAFDKIGSAIICYGVGILIGNIGILPDSIGESQEILMSVTVPLAIPLLLFSIDLKKWLRLAGKTLLSLLFIIIAISSSVIIGFFILNDYIEESNKIAGMLIGVYTGGTPNLSAIGLALNVKEDLIVLTNTADVLICSPWFFFMLAFGQRLLQTFLPKFKKAEVPAEGEINENLPEEVEQEDLNSYRGIFQKKTFYPLLGSFGLSILIFGVGGGLYAILPQEYSMAVLMLTITTLGIIASFFQRIRKIDKTFQLGQYIILIFCLVVGSMADVSELIDAAPTIIAFISIAIFGAWFIHLLLSAIFRVDADTVMITSISAFLSPPFVPVAAIAIRNKEVIVSGLATGIIGYAVGNYLGIAMGYFLAGYL